mgnify:CR=1 FL=1
MTQARKHPPGNRRRDCCKSPADSRRRSCASVGPLPLACQLGGGATVPGSSSDEASAKPSSDWIASSIGRSLGAAAGGAAAGRAAGVSAPPPGSCACGVPAGAGSKTGGPRGVWKPRGAQLAFPPQTLMRCCKPSWPRRHLARRSPKHCAPVDKNVAGLAPAPAAFSSASTIHFPGGSWPSHNVQSDLWTRELRLRAVDEPACGVEVAHFPSASDGGARLAQFKPVKDLLDALLRNHAN